MRLLRRLAATLSLVALCLQLHAKDDKDNDKFVRLMSAKSVRIIEIDGQQFRRAEGPARFLHNNTWLICDTALWNVQDQIIHATGNVRIEQENTELTSDSLIYIVNEDLAKFRGSLVQLRDKDNNTLRTHFLDYNTKDSIAVFKEGGAMRDKDGQLIESISGTYNSKQKLFTFQRRVNMFTDSVFVRTSLLNYQSDSSMATYPNYVEVWKDDNMMSAHSGWYDKGKEKFFFKDNVHALTKDRECWCDTLYFLRERNDIDMFGNVQVTDTTKNVHSLSGQAHYRDSIRTLTLRRDPVVIALAEEENKDAAPGEPKTKLDSVFMSSDLMVYNTVRKCDISKAETATAQKRIQEVSVDAIANIRAKAAEEAAKARQEAIEQEQLNGNLPPSKDKGKDKDKTKQKETDKKKPKADLKDTGKGKEPLEPVEQAAAPADTTASQAPEVKDTTDIGYLLATGKVKMFRRSMQVRCDSLRYCDLDSLIRLFKDPIVWNDKRHQYNADSLYLVVKNSRMDRAHLLSNAFIHIQEEENFFDQIRGAEMIAHFDDSTQLKRFDAMGSVTAIFFMKEKDKVATANRKESTIMSANFKNGEISDITYFENPKSDAYPVAQMKKDEKTLKGYKWSPDARPKSSSDITRFKPRKSERRHYESRPRAEFVQTERYFQGYMDKVYREIERSDSLRKVNEIRRQKDKHIRDSLSKVQPIIVDTLVNEAVADTTQLVKKGSSVSDTVNNLAGKIDLSAIDSLGVASVKDSLTTHAPKSAKDIQKQLRQQKKAAQQAERKAREEARQKALEEKWARQDARDAEKKAKKEARKAARKHKHEQDVLKRILKQKQKEDAMREKYKKMYLKDAEKGDFKKLALPQD